MEWNGIGFLAEKHTLVWCCLEKLRLHFVLKLIVRNSTESGLTLVKERKSLIMSLCIDAYLLQ